MIISKTLLPRALTIIALGFLLIVSSSLVLYKTDTKAACVNPLPTNRGQVKSTLNLSTSGTYTVWSRIKAPDNSSNSYKLQIDDVLCDVTVGDSSSGLPAETWTWVDYRDGNVGSKITVNLSAGFHEITMAGNEDGVLLDRVILTTDTNCTPTGTGDNCAPPDTTNPTASITSPTNGSNVQGTININANASDDAAISKVEFYLNGSLIGTDSTAPYSVSLDTTNLSNTIQILSAKAYDSSGNTADSNNITITVNNPLGNATSIFDNATPASIVLDYDGISVELGLKFKTLTDGKVKGVKFYKPVEATNSGHVGSLWDINGNRLAAVTFTNETASGWQEALFTTPVDIQADTIYVVSYHSPDGAYIGEDGGMSERVTNSPLIALADRESEGNGVYKFGPEGSFPNETYFAENYWVDVVFESGGGTNPPTYDNADINTDGSVDIVDLSILLSAWGNTSGPADINTDGSVDIVDLSILLSAWTG